ncbi:MAG: zinc ribbon domain-containing protein [Verrucomicrobia bacterium]|nr:zinc ribbon domain-containing protein [Verrucomicrobiota bacterium]
MPIYLYETIPAKPGEPARHFEKKQSMAEPALTHDPETGVPVRRVIQGGYLNTKRWTKGSPAPSKTGMNSDAASTSGGSCCGISGCGPH